MRNISFIFVLIIHFITSDFYTMNLKNKAPDFPENLEWLNTDNPIKISDLNGKIVLLDFWTYCCINCIHIMPDLKKLEEKYKSELVVIGVHSAKFLTEQSTDNIRQAILRYDIEHPVINDKEFETWNLYGANAWPTIVLIDPNGNIVNKRSGEGVFTFFDPLIGNLVKKFNKNIDTKPLKLSLEKDKKPKALLNFPGKVYADEKTGRLYISDSNNNRIIMCDLEGNIIDAIGSGKSGKADGSFEDSEFSHPQGVTAVGDILYIADTENDLIRKADLIQRNVSTVAGTGEQAYSRSGEADALTIPLNSPWDLVLNSGHLFIANAGSHQIWDLNIKTGRLKLHAGSGHENIVDDKLLNAALAQPSGITTTGKKLYIADSEVSAVREIDINEDGEVKTLIGKGLFVFGDEDGTRTDARLQHPLGIAYAGGLLYIADTYNNKIKIIDPEKSFSMTFAGTGKEGMKDGNLRDASFNEPGGISFAKGKLYIADTNNDLIRVIDTKQRIVSTLVLKNLDKLVKKKFVFNKNNYPEIIEVNDKNLRAVNLIQIVLNLPVGYKLNDLAPNQMRIFTEDGVYLIEKDINSPQIQTSIDVPDEYKKLYTELSVYYCRKDNEGLCLIRNILYEINDDSKSSSNSIKLSYNLKVQ